MRKIYHSRKLPLFDKRNTWMEKRVNLLDVAISLYDGVEVCVLIGTFLWDKSVKFLIKVILDYIGMTVYHFFRNKSGTQLDKIKKKLQTLRTLLGNNGRKYPKNR